MKNTVLAFAVIASIAVVAASIARPLLFVSPGKPIVAHQGFASDCFACHTTFLGSSAKRCTECHAVGEIGIRTTLGAPIVREKKTPPFHRRLREADCVACHSDHRGVRSFRAISRFSHELLEPALRNDCQDCHQRPADSLHRQIDANCGECHRPEAWVPATFDHSEYFRFDRHHRTECTTCHIDADYSRFTCYGCHEHSRSKVRREHLEEGVRDFENCAECHRSGDEDEAERLWKSMRRDAGKSGRTEEHEDRDD